MSKATEAPGKVIRIFRAENRLNRAVKRDKSRSREDMVAAAETCVETLRQSSVQAMHEMLERLQSMTESDRTMERSDLLHCCNVIITLAGTFGFPSLMAASMSLVDLVLQIGDRAKLKSLASMHICAMKIMAPGAAPLSDDDSRSLLAALGALVTYHGVTRPNDGFERMFD